MAHSLRRSIRAATAGSPPATPTAATTAATTNADTTTNAGTAVAGTTVVGPTNVGTTASGATGNGAAPVSARRKARRGTGLLVIGVLLTVASVALTAVVVFPTGLGTMLGLVLLYAFAAYYLVGGVVRLRTAGTADEAPGAALKAPSRTALADPTGWTEVAGTGTWRCALVGHREHFVARTAAAPPHFECRRCGAQRRGHLRTGHGWMCDLPLMDHRYDHQGMTEDQPELWQCRRCGKKRYTPPRSAGETLEATGVAKLWIKRGDL